MLMSENLVKVRADQASGTIVIDRPQRRNALSRATISAISQALDDLHLEKKARAVILTGAGTTFCAGMDLHELYETAQTSSAMQRWHEDAISYRDLLLQMLRFPKPVIAAVNGPAHGGGAGLLLACDLVVAAETSTFSVPAPQRGLVAGLVAPLLVFRIGAGHAARLLLTGEQIDAETAMTRGIFHETTSADLVWARANELAQQFRETSHEAVAMTKRMVNETIGEKLAAELTLGAAATATSKTTDAAAEGVAAFIEKRPPRWD